MTREEVIAIMGPKLSNPTLPDYGIDKAFRETDQRHYLLKCAKCGEYTCMEESFPDCLIEVNGRVIRACIKCRGELLPSAGEWVVDAVKVVTQKWVGFVMKKYSERCSDYGPS